MNIPSDLCASDLVKEHILNETGGGRKLSDDYISDTLSSRGGQADTPTKNTNDKTNNLGES